MERELLVFVGTSDLSGHFRGKSFSASDLVMSRNKIDAGQAAARWESLSVPPRRWRRRTG
jgi:hypothetical protein